MKGLFIFGAGKIGVALAHIFSQAQDYAVTLIDNQLKSAHLHFKNKLPQHVELVEADVNDDKTMAALIKSKNPEALISSLPFFCNPQIAKLAQTHALSYFDLTEDIKTVHLIDQLATQGINAYVPQCGVAPGFINIVASDLIGRFEEVEVVKLRCGALPVTSSNALGYALTWSVEGLINEYGNPCQAIVNHQLKEIEPLADLEKIQIEGSNYEAFNTSGGAGSLVETYLDKVKNLNYKSIRYPGHCEKMRFLMKGLNLNEHREILKTILENALPHTIDDVVTVYVAVNGRCQGKLARENFVKKFYPKKIEGVSYSAIQMITATAATVIVDIVLSNRKKYQGRIKQEDFTLEEVLQNRLAGYLNE